MNSESVQKMNRNKIGRRFKFSQGLISAAFAVKCALRLGYRQLQGFMEDVCSQIKKQMPNFRTIWWRIDQMRNEGIIMNVPSGRHTVIAIDSTGLRPVNDGEYRAMKYDKRREWVKLHIAVDVETNCILNFKISKGNVHDSLKFKRLAQPFSKNICEIFADKGYDSSEIFEFCKKRGIFAGIPVRLNANNSNSNSVARKEAIEAQLKMRLQRGSCRLNRHLTTEIKSINQEEWKKNVKYGRRSTVESVFSKYKRTLGETLFSRKWKNREKEIVAKINLLNRFATIN